MNSSFHDGYVWLVLLAPALSVVLVRALIAPAQRFGLVDHPGGRKAHEVSTPLVGGLMNAINMIDGVDGLAGSVVFSRCLFLPAWRLRQVLYKHVLPELVDRPKMGFDWQYHLWDVLMFREWLESRNSDNRESASIRNRTILVNGS